MKSKIGFDLDGTIACLDIAAMRRTKTRQELTSYYKSRWLVMDPNSEAQTDNIYIVTTRPEWARQLTKEWLHEHNVRYEKLIMLDFKGYESNKNWELVHAQAKAEALKQEGITKYYEDMPGIVNHLRAITDIEIVLVE